MMRLIDSLAFRIAVFLTIALLPIGLIAVEQTRKLSDEVGQRLEMSLIASTGIVVEDERAVIQRALGAAEVLSVILPPLNDRPDECYDFLQDYLVKVPRYSFAGYVNADGEMSCSSTNAVLDLSENPIFKAVAADPMPMVQIRPKGIVSNTSVLMAVHPVLNGDQFAGYAAVSVPHNKLDSAVDLPADRTPIDVITFNKEGTVLTSQFGLASVSEKLPDNRPLETLTGLTSYSFSAEDNAGRERIYVVVPIVPQTVYAMSIWDRETPFISDSSFDVTAGVFPILMWLASLAVAYFALHRLAFRHIRKLRIQMNQFALNRALPDFVEASEMPGELRDMENDFRYMAESLLQDEALMEGAMREKNVLLKEVHHRVKNNLQLISSIMNMHMRKARNAETKTVLKRLQDRVLGLATIHRKLYQSEDLGQLDAAVLLDEVINQMLVMGLPPGSNIDVKKDIEQISMFPDQAVPLSLLVSEALTNALKYVGKPDGDVKPWISIAFRRADDGAAVISVGNSKGAGTVLGDPEDGTGLGSKLMRSFATQLGASIDIEDDHTAYHMRAEFALREFSPDPVDY